MAITVELPKEVEERFVAQARTRGISVDVLLRHHIIETAPAVLPETESRMTPGDWERSLNEWLDSLPVGAEPIADDAYRRESIYATDDELK